MKSATTEQLPSAYITTKVKGVKCVREINKTKAYGDIYKTGVRLRWFMDKGVKKLASVKQDQRSAFFDKTHLTIFFPQNYLQIRQVTSTFSSMNKIYKKKIL